jgi:hypothetical protein
MNWDGWLSFSLGGECYWAVAGDDGVGGDLGATGIDGWGGRSAGADDWGVNLSFIALVVRVASL